MIEIAFPEEWTGALGIHYSHRNHAYWARRNDHAGAHGVV